MAPNYVKAYKVIVTVQGGRILLSVGMRSQLAVGALTDSRSSRSALGQIQGGGHANIPYTVVATMELLEVSSLLRNLLC